jgi:protein-S-isoprenylcysteine O-methyltransferase Ste14
MTPFIIIWSVWLISEIIINRLFRADTRNKKDLDRNSVKIIWRIIGTANIMAICFVVFTKIQISRSILLPYLGLVVIIAGMIIRFTAVVSLGKLFTVNVNISENHRIVQHGIYRFIRHPSYLGAIISFAGFGLSLNNWLSLIIILILIPGVMIYRIKIEEKVLVEQFGDEYLQYMKTTYRLVPWLW